MNEAPNKIYLFYRSQGQHVTTYTTGPGPSEIVKQKEPLFKDSFC